MVVAELKITLHDNGTVEVSGPINQLMNCYGLLEMAKDSLRNHAMENAKKIQAPQLGEVSRFGNHQ